MAQVSAEPTHQVGLRAGGRLIWRYFRQHPKPLGLAIGGASLFGIATVVSSRALGDLADDVLRPAFSGGTPKTAQVVSLFVAVGVLRVVFALVRRTNAAFARQDNLATWQRRVVRQFLGQPLSFFRRRPTGDLLAAAETDADAAVNVLSPLPFACGVIVLLGAAAVWMLSLDWVLGAVALVLLPFLAVSNQWFERKAEGPVNDTQASLANLSGSVHEMVDGFGAIKALGLEHHQRTKVHRYIGDVENAKLRTLRIRAWFEGAQDVLLPTVNVVLLLLGGYRVEANAVSVGDLAGVLGLFNLLVWPLRLLGFVLADLPRSVIAAARMDDMLREPVPPSIPGVEPLHSTNAFELEDVRLVHDDGRVALDQIDLHIVKGSRVAVVGGTGAGKSTLLDVLTGLEPPTAGIVRRAGLVSAMVFQEPYVLSGSVTDNLTLGQARDSASIEAALRVSEASFVDDLPNGRASVIGERGITLSGGQRQRLALARAIAVDADVLLLDDTTSALDAQTEERVLNALAQLGRDHTLILIAARPSTISFAERVLVLDRGRIVGDGTHDELLATNEQYQELFEALAQHAVDESEDAQVVSQ
jgi:ATP-binding cassette, subfamily B, bacterial